MVLIDQQKMCRTCLKFGIIMIPLTKTIEAYKPLTVMDLLQISSFVNIFDDDNCPKKICHGCYNKLKTFYKFKLLCQESDKIISKYIEQNCPRQPTTINMEIDAPMLEATEIKVEVDSNFEFPCGPTEEIKSVDIFETGFEIKQEIEFVDIKQEEIEENLSSVDMAHDGASIHSPDVEQNFDEETSDLESISVIDDLEKNQSNNDLYTKPTDFEHRSIKNPIENVIKIICLTCKSDFKEEGLYMYHVRLKHKDVVFNQSMEYTLNSVCRRRIYYCKKCELLTRNRIKFLNHERKHTYDSRKSRLCMECNKKCNNGNIHKQHTSECFQKKLICHFCYKRLPNSNLYESHMNEMHKKKENGPYLCPECGELFVDYVEYHAHLQIHTGAKTFNCDKCDAVFAEWSALKQHETTHAQNSNFICPYCGNQYKSKGSLQRHLLVHGDGKECQCHICGMKFNDKQLLRKHSLVHPVQRDFICHICHKGSKPKKCPHILS